MLPDLAMRFAISATATVLSSGVGNGICHEPPFSMAGVGDPLRIEGYDKKKHGFSVYSLFRHLLSVDGVCFTSSRSLGEPEDYQQWVE